MDKENPYMNLDQDFVADLGVPFVCSKCNELFGNQEYLSQHTDICHGAKHEFNVGSNFDSHQSTDFYRCQLNDNTHHNSETSSFLVGVKPCSFRSNSMFAQELPNPIVQNNDPSHNIQAYSLFSSDTHEQSCLPQSLSVCDPTQDNAHLSMQRNDVLLSSSTQNNDPTLDQPLLFSPNPAEDKISSVNNLSYNNTATFHCHGCQHFCIDQWVLDQHVKQCPKLLLSGCHNQTYHKTDVCECEDSDKKSPVRCSKCLETFTNKISLDQHKLTCCPVNHEQLPGELCQPSLSGVGEIYQGSSLRDKDQNGSLPLTSSTNIEAEQSSASATPSEQCEIHLSNDTSLANELSDLFHDCSDCGKSFSLRSSLLAHVRSHTGEKPFSCGECGQKFSHKGNLKKHYRTHTQEKPYHCTLCGVSFSQRSGLTIHWRTHTGEKPFECTECGQKFSSTGNLRKHMMIHTGEKPFGCKACGRRYQSDEALKAHVTIHTGEKSFLCPLCDAAFTHRGGLEAHFRTHTGEKPFACDYCDLTFARRGGLKAHIRTHTGEKPYVCSLCEQAFAHKSNLNAHFRTHTGEKPFSCLCCEQKFAHKSNLKKHMNTHLERSGVTSPSDSLSDSSCTVSDTSHLPSSSVISTVTKMTSVVVSPFAENQDSNFIDLLDMLEHPSTQALLKT